MLSHSDDTPNFLTELFEIPALMQNTCLLCSRSLGFEKRLKVWGGVLRIFRFLSPPPYPKRAHALAYLHTCMPIRK